MHSPATSQHHNARTAATARLRPARRLVRRPAVLAVVASMTVILPGAGPASASAAARSASPTAAASHLVAWMPSDRHSGLDRHSPLNGPTPGKVTYHGGPVQTAPVVYIDYWGWSSDADSERPYLTGFLGSVPGSPWLNTVNQYSGAGSDPVLGGTWGDPSPAPSNPTSEQLGQEVLNASQQFGLSIGSDMTNDIILVALPDGVSITNTAPGACAYHSYADLTEGSSTSQLPFIVFPYLPTYDPSSCGSAYADGDVRDGVSIVAGHELAETITDPLGDGWYLTNGQGEIADKCAWYNLAAAVMLNEFFPVQPLWSNSANSCVLAKNAGSKSWSPQITIPSQHTAGSPSFAFAFNTLWSAYRGQTSNDVYVQSDTYTGWAPKVAISGASTASSPSIAYSVDTGVLAVAWTDSSTGAVDTAGGLDGEGWDPMGQAGAGKALSSTGPAICGSANGQDLYVAYTGHTSDNVYISSYYVNASGEGSGWGSQIQVPGASTTQAPAIACDGPAGTETIAWTTSGDQIDYSTYNGSTFTSPAAIPQAGTSSGPGLAASAGGQLTAAWKGTSTGDVYYSSLVSGSWTSQTTIPGAKTNIGPGLAWADAGAEDTPGLTLVVGWTGKSEQIFYSGSNRP